MADTDRSALCASSWKVAVTVVAAVSVTRQGAVPEQPPPLQPVKKVIRIRSADGTIDLRTLNLAQGPRLETDPALEQRALAGTASYGDVRWGGAMYRSIYYPFTDTSGRKLLAVVGISTGPLERTLSSLLGALGVGLTAGGLAAARGAARLARRLTRPLERIAEGARVVSEASLSARIPEVSPDVELREVTAILNAMLGRLEAAFQMERRFLADTSHELRSPLANIRGTIEVALRRARSGDEYRDTLAVSLAEVERLSRLVNDLLRLSRADTGQLPFTFAPCQLPAVAEDAVKAHASSARDRSVRLTLDAPEPIEGGGQGSAARGDRQPGRQCPPSRAPGLDRGRERSPGGRPCPALGPGLRPRPLPGGAGACLRPLLSRR